MRFYYTILLIFSLIGINAQNSNNSVIVPQFPVVKTPQNNIYNKPNSPNNRPQNPHNPAAINNIQQRNEAIMQEVEQYERMKEEAQKQKDIDYLIHSGFPSLSSEIGTSAYYDAFDEINNMLNGNMPLNLGRAVFLAENAYHNNKYEYNAYHEAIKEKIRLINLKIDEEKHDKNSNLVKNMMLFRLLSDTLKIKDKKNKQTLNHLPIKYNLDDYKSEINYDSHFVTTLMQTGKGQCYSMPLYYLVLAEEIGADAYWSFSPKHSFIKIQDDENRWFNIELTAKAILSDAHYMNNSYIKAEAIRNRIYLEPLDKTNAVANMLLELARGYYSKYGYDDFYLKCVDTAIKYTSNNVDALTMKSAYQTRLTLVLAQLLDAANPEILKQKSPEAYRHYELMQELYNQIDAMGYEELPNEIYAKWLEHIEKEKEKANKLPSIFINIPKEK